MSFPKIYLIIRYNKDDFVHFERLMTWVSWTITTTCRCSVTESGRTASRTALSLWWECTTYWRRDNRKYYPSYPSSSCPSRVSLPLFRFFLFEVHSNLSNEKIYRVTRSCIETRKSSCMTARAVPLVVPDWGTPSTPPPNPCPDRGRGRVPWPRTWLGYSLAPPLSWSWLGSGTLT